MADEVIELDAHRPDPHCVLRCDSGHVHVLSVAWIEALIAQAPDVEPLEPCQLRAILREWIAR